MIKKLSLVGALLICALTVNAQLNLSLVSNYQYPGSRGDCSDIWGYVDELGNEYAIVGNESGTSIMDISDPANPVEVFYSAGAQTIWRDIKVWGDYAYITNEGGGGLKIIDMTALPGTITAGDVTQYTGSTYPFSTAHNMYIDEVGRGYVLGADNGVGGAIILDLTGNPMAPTELGRYNDYYLHDGYARGDTLWGGAINDGFFVAVDVSNPGSTTTLATQLTPNTFSHNVWASDDGQTVFTTDEISGAYVASYDVSDLGNIVELDRVQSSPGQGVIPHNTFVRGNFVVTSYYRDGIVIHDVTNPANMIEVGNYDSSPLSGDGFNGLWGVYPYLPSGKMIGSDIEGGLFVWDVTWVQAAYLEGNITDAVTTNAINNAQIDIVGENATDLSDAAGDYATGLGTAGTYTVTVSKLGYNTATINNVVLTNGSITTLDVELQPVVTVTLSGQVIDESSNPIVGAQLYITDGVYSNTVTTNGVGNFDITGFIEGTYDVYIGSWGHHSACWLGESLTGAGSPYVYQLETGYSDDFMLDLGWSTFGTATTGDWERVEPEGTTSGGSQSNPDFDATGDCGDMAFITGNGGGQAGNDDIDDGEVTLLSPVFDLSTYNDPYIRFDRWFFNDGGQGAPNDSLVISLANGTESQVIDFAVDNDPDEGAWAFKNIRISDFLTPSATMQLRVHAMDIGQGHLAEAGFDRFMIVDGADVGLEESTSSVNVVVYPSPFTEELTVKIDAVAESFRVEVIELATGRSMDVYNFEASGTYKVQNNYASGMYLIKVFGDQELLKTERVVKM